MYGLKSLSNDLCCEEILGNEMVLLHMYGVLTPESLLV